MRTIRTGVFETNSSSCHAFAMVTDDEIIASTKRKIAIYYHEGYSCEDETYSTIVVTAEQFKDIVESKNFKNYDKIKDKIEKVIDKCFSDTTDRYDHRKRVREIIDEYDRANPNEEFDRWSFADVFDNLEFRHFIANNADAVRSVGNTNVYIFNWSKSC